jgi:hypothetical protein
MTKALSNHAHRPRTGTLQHQTRQTHNHPLILMPANGQSTSIKKALNNATVGPRYLFPFHVRRR